MRNLHYFYVKIYPNSLDLNPVDYKVWSVPQEKIYQHRVNGIGELHEQ